MDHNIHLFILSVFLIVISGEDIENASGNVVLKKNCQPDFISYLRRQETNPISIRSEKNFRQNCRNFGIRLRSKGPSETPQDLATLKLKEPAESIIFKNTRPHFMEKAWRYDSYPKIVLKLRGNMELLKTGQQLATSKLEKAVKTIVFEEGQQNVKLEKENFQREGQNFKSNLTTAGNLLNGKERLETQQRQAMLTLKKPTNIVLGEGQQKLTKVVKKNFKQDTQNFKSLPKMAKNLLKSKTTLETLQCLATLNLKKSVDNIDLTGNQFEFKMKNKHFMQIKRLKIEPNITKKYFEVKEPLETKQHLVTLKPNNTIDLFNLKTNSIEVLQIIQGNLSLKNLNSLEYFFKVDTLVLYGQWHNVPELGQVFSSNHPPVVKITDPIEWKLKDLFSSNILSIVLLGADYPLEKQLLNPFNLSLEGEHLQKVIFITQFSIKKEEISEEFRQLFKWLHANGFWQSLLMDLEGSTLTFEHLIGEFKRNLTLKDFLMSDIKWLDLKGFSINCAMGSNPPRAYIQRDAQNKVTLKGYYGTIINLFVKHYNATLNPVVLSNLDYYTELDCVKYINAKKVDICGDGMPIDPQYVIAYAEEIYASYLIVPCGQPLPRFYYFLRPFQPSVWTLVTCSIVFLGLTLSIIHRLQYGSWNVSLHMLYALLSVLYLPFNLCHIKGHYRRFLEILLILLGFVVANWYLSILSSLLFTRLYFDDFQSPQDLAAHNISIMVNEFEYFLLNGSKTDPIIMQQLKVVSNDILLEHRRNLDPHYAYYSQYDKVSFYLYQQKFLLRPRMQILTGISPITEDLGGLPMSINWPFQHLLTDFLRCISESGLSQRFDDGAFKEGILSGYLHYFPTEYHYVEPLSLEYFQMAAILLAVGYSLAFVSFLLELVVVLKFKKTQVVLENK